MFGAELLFEFVSVVVLFFSGIADLGFVTSFFTTGGGASTLSVDVLDNLEVGVFVSGLAGVALSLVWGAAILDDSVDEEGGTGV